MRANSTCTVISEVRCQLGEGPCWSARENALYWVDILAPAVHRYSLTSEQVTSWPMPEKIGWLIERRDDAGFIAGFQSGFYQLTLEPFWRQLIVDPEPHLPDNRMNDAKADSQGRIWAGTMDCETRSDCGSLYCLDTDLQVRQHDRGYIVANGPAFGTAAECMYHTDSGRQLIYRYELGADGLPRSRQEFLRFPDDWGSPDGMTVDEQGHLWVAHWGGGRVSCFTRDAKLSRQIELPASLITSCVFAGQALDRLFVTSAATGKADEPQAGSLFEVDPGDARGIAPHLFGA